jgi:glutamine amidotransferase
MIKSMGFLSETLVRPKILKSNSIYILPGVGSFDEGVKRLKKTGWDIFLKEVSLDPSNCILGICLGMQLLCERSEEGQLEGLQLIPGVFKHFKSILPEPLTKKIPHMGWNGVEFIKSDLGIFDGLQDTSKYYFVHSYAYTHPNSNYAEGMTKYGITFPSIIKKRNVLGFQFHPEKSHKYGKLLLEKVILKF